MILAMCRSESLPGYSVIDRNQTRVIDLECPVDFAFELVSKLRTQCVLLEEVAKHARPTAL